MATPSSENLIKATLDAYYEAQGGKDGAAAAGCFCKGAVAHIPVGAPVLDTPEALEEYFRGLLVLVAKLEMRQDAVFIVGSGAAVKWSATAHDEEDRTVEFEGIDVFETDEEAKIQVLMSYWDPAEMLMRLKG